MTDQKALEGALLKGAQTIEDAQGQIQSELSSLQSGWYWLCMAG